MSPMSPTESHGTPVPVPPVPSLYRGRGWDSALGVAAEVRVRAGVAAQELLRTALLARLAVDLDDPALARRAATAAVRHARLLAGLSWPTARADVGAGAAW